MALQRADLKNNYLYNINQYDMLSKNDIKNIKSLEIKKFRVETGLFAAEGHKLVGELLGTFHCKLVVATEDWLDSHRRISADRIETVTPEELRRASLMQAPQDVIALFSIPRYDGSMAGLAAGNLVLALDDIQDPGNLGTIVRIADWFGIHDIFCSKGTADIYNPKSVQATMGALARVRLHYCDLDMELSAIEGTVPVFGTFLDGENMYARTLSRNGVIVMGNEGNGISSRIGRHVTDRLFIPNWPAGSRTSESLNVAVATAIVCAEFRRRNG